MGGAILCAGAARAEDTIPYEVQHGESLYGIAERLFDDARRWPEVARLNRLARPSRLQPGQRLLLPVSLLKGTAMTARVEYVRGPVRAGGTALRIGDAVAEGTALEVGVQGFVSLRLHDGSLLQLQSNSHSKLLRLRDLPVAQRRNTLIELDKGRADATVAPQSPGSRFEVKTPLATAGVRGTRFGVSIAAEAMRATADVVEGRVEVQAGRLATPAAVNAGQGAVVRRDGAAPELKPLLPAPDLSGLPERVERIPGPLPLQATAGAARYRVEIAEDEAYTRVPWSAEGPLPVVLDGLPDGRYHLRVRAIDPDDLLGAEATGPLWIKTTPVPPLAQTPRPDEIVVPEGVTITCTEVPQAQAYLLQMATNPRFEPLLRQEQGAGHCRFELQALPVGEVYWRVASLAPEGDGRLERGPFSDPSRFVVVPLPMPPRADQITADGRQVHWAAVEGYRYRVQVATDIGFGTVVQDEEVHGDRFQLSLPPSCAPYALRLQAIDPHGHRSAFSPPRLVSTGAVLCSGDGTPVRSGGGHVQSPR
jgi:hypothetical protein